MKFGFAVTDATDNDASATNNCPTGYVPISSNQCETFMNLLDTNTPDLIFSNNINQANTFDMPHGCSIKFNIVNVQHSVKFNAETDDGSTKVEACGDNAWSCICGPPTYYTIVCYFENFLG